MSTKREITGKRDLTFSGWIRDNLPDSSTGYMVSDGDFIIYDYKNKHIALIEQTNYGQEMPDWQKCMYQDLSNWIEAGIAAKGDNWKFEGWYNIKFQKKCFDDGWCSVNGKLMTEDEVKNLFSFNGYQSL